MVSALLENLDEAPHYSVHGELSKGDELFSKLLTLTTFEAFQHEQLRLSVLQ
jgi:hypothetical protein